MPIESRPRIEVSPEVRERARIAREKLTHRPGLEDVEDFLYFYPALRQAVHGLKTARIAASLTLAQVAEKSGQTEETLARLEAATLHNPTWKTLGDYAHAVGLNLSLALAPDSQVAT